MSRNKAIGTAAETAVVNYLRLIGVTHAERRALNGRADRGDIAGLPGVVIEVKAHRDINLAEFVDEAETERRNDNADVAAAWIKRRGKGSPGEWYVAMTGHQFCALLSEAGYIDTPEGTP